MSDQEMKYYSSYARLGRRWWRRPAARGFRLSPTRRLSVRRLRARLWTLLGLLGRCVRNVRLLTRGLVVPSSGGGGGGGSTSPSARGKGRRALAMLGGKDRAAAAAGKRAQAAAAPATGGGKQDGSTGGGNSKAARRPPCMRSNSFYARAVAECLEFIKGSNNAGGGAATPARDNRVK